MPKGNPGQPKKHHTGEFKQQVVEYLRTNEASYRETGRHFGIKHDMVKAWERIYLEEGAEGLYVDRRGRACSASGTTKGKPRELPKEVEEDLIAENQRLRMELDYLKKLNALVRENQLQEKKRK